MPSVATPGAGFCKSSTSGSTTPPSAPERKRMVVASPSSPLIRSAVRFSGENTASRRCRNTRSSPASFAVQVAIKATLRKSVSSVNADCVCSDVVKTACSVAANRIVAGPSSAVVPKNFNAVVVPLQNLRRVSW